ncbi:MAG: phage major capsid protein [Candidatus Caldarchaeum sp.]
MSLVYSEIKQVFDTIRLPLADLIARSNPLLRSLPKRAVASDAIYLRTKMSSDHNARAIEDGSAVILDSPKTNYVAGKLDWATYIAEFSIPKRLIAQAEGQPGMLGRLVLAEIEDAAKDLADKIAVDLWGGTTANGLVGMQTVVANNNTYAGIDRTVASNANWRAVVTDAGGAEISSSLMRIMDRNFFNRNKYGFLEAPTKFTGMTTAAFMAKYAGLLTDVNISLTSGTVPAIQANALNRGMLEDFGSVIGYAGIPFLRNANISIPDTDTADTSRLYILDPEYWFLATLSNDLSEAAVHQTLGANVAPVVDGIRADVEILGNTGEILNGYIKTYVQLVCTDPAKGGTVLKNVDVSE